MIELASRPDGHDRRLRIRPSTRGVLGARRVRDHAGQEGATEPDRLLAPGVSRECFRSSHAISASTLTQDEHRRRAAQDRALSHLPQECGLIGLSACDRHPCPVGGTDTGLGRPVGRNVLSPPMRRTTVPASASAATTVCSDVRVQASDDLLDIRVGRFRPVGSHPFPPSIRVRRSRASRPPRLEARPTGLRRSTSRVCRRQSAATGRRSQTSRWFLMSVALAVPRS